MPFFLIFLCLLGVSVHAANNLVVIHVDDNYHPYSYAENGKAEGVYIDILRSSMERLPDYEVELRPVSWEKGKKLMESGEAFALAPVFYHGHDWKYVYPYSFPFFEEKIIVVCRENILSSHRSGWPEDYEGLRISGMVGFDGWGGSRFRLMVKQGKIQYSEYQGVENNILLLGQNRADCMLAEERSFNLLYAKLQEYGRYVVSDTRPALVKGTVTGLDPVFIGYSEAAIESGNYPFQQQFRKQLDNVLYQLYKSGEIEAVAKNSFSKQRYGLVKKVKGKLELGGIAGSINHKISASILKEAYDFLGIETNFHTMPAKRSILESDLGKFDGETQRIKGIGKDYPNLLRIPVPLLEIEIAAYSKNHDLRIESWQSLKPYSIGLRRGIIIAESYTKDLRRVLVNSESQLLEMLLWDRLDIIIGNTYKLDSLIRKQGLSSVKELSPLLIKQPLYHYLNRSKSELADRITLELQRMKLSGRIDQIRIETLTNEGLL